MCCPAILAPRVGLVCVLLPFLNLLPLFQPMTKKQEIESLGAFVASLPAGSYLRVWLSGVFEAVETDIQNDHFPSVTPSETRAQVHQLEKEGKDRAAFLVSSAESQAARIIETARKQAADILGQAERVQARFRRLVSDFMTTL